MYTTNLKKVGGSVMLTVPPALLDVLEVSAGSTVGMAVENGQLVVKPDRKKRRRYTLKELIAQCDPSAPIPQEAREWQEAPAVGKEAL